MLRFISHNTFRNNWRPLPICLTEWIRTQSRNIHHYCWIILADRYIPYITPAKSTSVISALPAAVSLLLPLWSCSPWSEEPPRGDPFRGRTPVPVEHREVSAPRERTRSQRHSLGGAGPVPGTAAARALRRRLSPVRRTAPSTSGGGWGRAALWRHQHCACSRVTWRGRPFPVSAGSAGPEVGVVLPPARPFARNRSGALLTAPPGCRRGPWGLESGSWCEATAPWGLGGNQATGRTWGLLRPCWVSLWGFSPQNVFIFMQVSLSKANRLAVLST